jgi:MFS family permease
MYLLLGLLGGMGVTATDIFISSLSDLTFIFKMPIESSGLILSVYFLSTAIFSALYPFILKILPPNLLFTGSLIMFSCASVSIAFPVITSNIIVCRILQGVAFGILTPMIITLIKQRSYNDSGKSFALYSFSAELMSCLAPIIGAFTYKYISWKAPFLIIGIITIFFIVFLNRGYSLSKESKDISFYNFANLYNSIGFMKFNAISMLMIGTGWGLITISSLYVFNDMIYHATFYFIYSLLYALGSLVYSRMDSRKLLSVSEFFYLPIAIVAVFIVFGLSMKITPVFVIGCLVFGLLSGLSYGMILDKALSSLSANDWELGSSVITFSRLIGSFVFIEVCSRVYFWDPKYFMLFITAILFFISFLSKKYEPVERQVFE